MVAVPGECVCGPVGEGHRQKGKTAKQQAVMLRCKKGKPWCMRLYQGECPKETRALTARTTTPRAKETPWLQEFNQKDRPASIITNSPPESIATKLQSKRHHEPMVPCNGPLPVTNLHNKESTQLSQLSSNLEMQGATPDFLEHSQDKCLRKISSGLYTFQTYLEYVKETFISEKQSVDLLCYSTEHLARTIRQMVINPDEVIIPDPATQESLRAKLKSNKNWIEKITTHLILRDFTSFMEKTPSGANEMKGKPWNVDKDVSKLSSSSE
ncbi:Il6 [Columba livia]|nr:Il6 [Columba livia]